MSAVASVSNATGTISHATHAHHQGRHGAPEKAASKPPPSNTASTAPAATPAVNNTSKANVVV